MAWLIPSSVAVHQGRDDRVWRQHSAVYSRPRPWCHCRWRSVTGCARQLRHQSVLLPSSSAATNSTLTTHVLVRALIHSRLDCNPLFAGFPASKLARLHSVLKAAARLVLGLSGCASVTALMHNSLHWLNYPQRVTYKLTLLTYKCLQSA